MLYKILEDKLESKASTVIDKELELENILVSSQEDGVLKSLIFGEDLLFLGSKIRTKSKKRSDILALDVDGNPVIIELKKDAARLGIDTQALQYVVDISLRKNGEFLDYCADLRSKAYSTPLEKEKDILKSFLSGHDVDTNNLNQRQSIILMVRNFDETLFSMGQWLSSHNIPFKCISYNLHEINGDKYLSFSVVFDQLGTKQKRFFQGVSSKLRTKPLVFWYNIGFQQPNDWDLMKNEGFISAGFEGRENDRGWIILNDFIVGDKIIAYASQTGVIGYGEITSRDYCLVKKGTDKDHWNGLHLHRHPVTWRSLAPDFQHSISPTDLKELKLHHPIQTRQIFPSDKFDSLKYKFEQMGWRTLP